MVYSLPDFTQDHLNLYSEIRMMFNQFMYYESNDYDYYLIYVKLENGTR